jgi:hypothetical protein
MEYSFGKRGGFDSRSIKTTFRGRFERAGTVPRFLFLSSLLIPVAGVRSAHLLHPRYNFSLEERLSLT